MSTLHVRFRSEALSRNGEFYMHLPPKDLPFFLKDNPYYKRKTKTLILLHGYSGDSTDWLYNSKAAEFSLKYNLAVVMPNADISFYVNKQASGHRYADFIGQDLINYLRDTFRLALKKEDTFIGGVSMGGFGALHTGLMFPETFGGIIALSSALIVYNLSKMKKEMPDPVMANYEYYTDTFGDLKKALISDHNPEVLYQRNLENKVSNPRIYMACGLQDFLLEPNHRMRDFLQKQNADFLYEEEDGVHDWVFWTPHAEKGIEYLLKRKK